MKKTLKNLNLAIELILKALIFLLPIFFLPWTTTLNGMDNFNKQGLLLLLVPLAVFIFLFIQNRQEKFIFKYSFLDYFIFAFGGIFLAATIFSIDRFSSVFGAYSYIGQSLLSLSALIGTYFLVVNYYSKKTEALSLLRIFFWLYNLIIISSSLLVFGYSIRLLSNPTLSVWFKSSLGNVDDLAMLIAVLNIMVLAWIYGKDSFYATLNTLKQNLLQVSLALSFILLILINFTPAWIGLLLGVGVFLFLNKKASKEKIACKKRLLAFVQNRKNLWLALAIIVPAALIIFNTLTYSSAVSLNRSSQKLQAGNLVSLEIARQAIMKRPVFGYGPETYAYAYSFLRPNSENYAEYWYLRFNHGASFLADLFVTVGIFGYLAYVVMLVILAYLIFIYVRKIKKKGENLGEEAALLAILIVLGLMQIFYSMNLVLLFLFWLSMGIFMILMREIYAKNNSALFMQKEFSSEISQRLLVMKIFIFFFAWVLAFALSGRYFAADYFFKKSLSDNDNNKTERNLQLANKLNPYRFNYQVAIAKYYKEAVISEMAQKNKDIELVKSDIGNSIYWAKQATKTAPYSVIAQETLASVYRDLGTYIKGDQNLAIDTFKKALTLEPSNPVLASELGNAYYAEGLNEDAVKWYQYSYNLKNDNYDAAFGMAKIMINSKQEREAMDILAKLEKAHPSAEVYYEQGRILYNLKNYDHAIIKFQQTISVSPLHANALYSLGLALAENGETEAALHYFKKVSELNPNNAEVKEKIKSLEK